MKLLKTTSRKDFEVLHSTASSQTAMMTLPPKGKSSEGSANEHAWAEQWLYVLQGEGKCGSHKLEPGALLLIEKGEPHEIENTGDTPLVTLNVYTPPAYDDEGPLYGGTKL
jgi:mannose-6-phosphate isomerase-like protein (cupin superfamily)